MGEAEKADYHFKHEALLQLASQVAGSNSNPSSQVDVKTEPLEEVFVPESKDGDSSEVETRSKNPAPSFQVFVPEFKGPAENTGSNPATVTVKTEPPEQVFVMSSEESSASLSKPPPVQVASGPRGKPFRPIRPRVQTLGDAMRIQGDAMKIQRETSMRIQRETAIKHQQFDFTKLTPPTTAAPVLTTTSEPPIVLPTFTLPPLTAPPASEVLLPLAKRQPPSAFQLFQSEKGGTVMKNLAYPTHSNGIKKLTQMWSSLPIEERVAYEKRAVILKSEYLKLYSTDGEVGNKQNTEERVAYEMQAVIHKSEYLKLYGTDGEAGKTQDGWGGCVTLAKGGQAGSKRPDKIPDAFRMQRIFSIKATLGQTEWDNKIRSDPNFIIGINESIANEWAAMGPKYHQAARKHYKSNIDWYLLQWLHVMSEDEKASYYNEAEDALIKNPHFIIHNQKNKRPPHPFVLFNNEIYQEHFRKTAEHQDCPEVLQESSERYLILLRI